MPRKYRGARATSQSPNSKTPRKQPFSWLRRQGFCRPGSWRQTPETPKLPYKPLLFVGLGNSRLSRWAQVSGFTEKWRKSAIFISPRVLTNAVTAIIYCRTPRNRKENDGLVIRIAYTCKMGFGPYCVVLPA